MSYLRKQRQKIIQFYDMIIDIDLSLYFQDERASSHSERVIPRNFQRKFCRLCQTRFVAYRRSRGVNAAYLYELYFAYHEESYRDL